MSRKVREHRQELHKYAKQVRISNILIHKTGPQSRPVMIKIFTHVIRPSVHTRAKITASRTVGLAKWIIDNSCLLWFLLLINGKRTYNFMMFLTQLAERSWRHSRYWTCDLKTVVHLLRSRSSVYHSTWSREQAKREQLFLTHQAPAIGDHLFPTWCPSVRKQKCATTLRLRPRKTKKKTTLQRYKEPCGLLNALD